MSSSSTYHDPPPMDHFALKSASLGAMGSLLMKLDKLARTDDGISVLRDAVGSIRTKLAKLSQTDDPSLTMNYWMKDARELSYDMEDCVDQFIYAEDADDKMPWISSLLGFLSRVEEVRERYDMYNLDCSLRHPTTTIRHLSRTMYREPTPVLTVGMETAINKLCELIEPKSDDENDLQLKVVSIIGVEGVGKSTLAQKLWLELEGQFECKAFVQTAKTPDMRIILKTILSQICLHQTPEACQVPNLIHDIRRHLQDKRYLIIIDDLWAVSVWDVLSRSLLEGDRCSRVITTTTIDDVALASCGYDPEHIIRLEPLDAVHSYQLFISRLFGSGKGCPPRFSNFSADITRKCGGLPLAIICIATVVGSHPEAIEHWEHVQSFLHHNLRTSSSYEEILKQVLKLCYRTLPHCLKTCLLYLSVYPENYSFLKDDLVKQWIAEDFIICKTEGTDVAEFASSYFDELLCLGLIQQIDTDIKKKGLSYVVHPAVFDFITSKSMEDNFITVIDYSQSRVELTERIRRLSLHFGSAIYATQPASIDVSQVRSLTFMGLLNCMPSLAEFRLVRIVILHIRSNDGATRLSLTEICEMLLLSYLQVRCNVTVQLPQRIRCLKHLEILEINARVEEIPCDLVHVRNLFNVCLGEKKHKHLTLGQVPSGKGVSLDDSSSEPTPRLQILELQPTICIPSGLPVWIHKLRRLYILEIVVREVNTEHICPLGELPALTALSLYVRIPTTGPIVFSKGMFPALKYFKFVSGVVLLDFREEAMPNLRRLKLGFNAHRGEKYSPMLKGIQHLLNLDGIAASIGAAKGSVESDRIAAESAFNNSIGKQLCLPSFKVKRVDRVDEEDAPLKEQSWTQEKESLIESSRVIVKKFKAQLEESLIEQHGILGLMPAGGTAKHADFRPGQKGDAAALSASNADQLVLPDDQYEWKKYGQKYIKSIQKIRSYFRCRHKQCGAKKKVEWIPHDPSGDMRIVYEGTHQHAGAELQLGPLGPRP